MTYTLRIIKLLAGQPLETQKTLLRLAQLVDEKQSKFDLDKARRASPWYWNSLGLDNYKLQIAKILGTNAQPNTDQFYEAVYNYQEKNPGTGGADGILGPKTFTYMYQTNKSSLPRVTLRQRQPRQPGSVSGPQNSGTGPTMSLPFDPRGKSQEEITTFARKMGFVHLGEIGIPYKNHPWVTPELATMLKGLNQEGLTVGAVTEAWPASSRHQDPNHFNGRGVDFIMKSWNHHAAAAAYCRKFGFDVLDEYVANTRYKTGAHIHVDMGNRPSVTDDTKYLAWQELRQKGLA